MSQTAAKFKLPKRYNGHGTLFIIIQINIVDYNTYLEKQQNRVAIFVFVNRFYLAVLFHDKIKRRKKYTLDIYFILLIICLRKKILLKKLKYLSKSLHISYYLYS